MEESKFVQQAKEALRDSYSWFPEQSRSLGFLGLALAGEVGEVANIVKKIERGSLDLNDPQVRYDLIMELTDVYTYLMLMAGNLQADLSVTYEVKREENVRRFGKDQEDGI